MGKEDYYEDESWRTVKVFYEIVLSKNVAKPAELGLHVVQNFSVWNVGMSRKRG